MLPVGVQNLERRRTGSPWRADALAAAAGDASDDVWVPGDYHLREGSPCIDAGTSEGAPTTDIEGNGRPYGAAFDIGAYEMGECPLPT